MKKLNLFQLIAAIVYPLICFTTTAYTKSYNIVAFGDFGEEKQDAQIMVRDSIKELSLVEPLWYGFFLGDNFYPAGVRSTEDRQFMNKLVNVYQELELPFKAALGNHDHLGNIESQIKFTKHSKNPYVRGANKLWQMNGSIYSHRWHEPDLEVFVLDTEMADPRSPGSLAHFVNNNKLQRGEDVKLYTRSWDNQIEWLEKVLKKSPSRWKFVIGHHPIVSDVSHNQLGINHRLHENYQKLRNLLTKYAHLYISGHDHSLQIHEIEQLQNGYGPIQIISGSGGTTHTIKKFHKNNALYRATPGSQGYMRIRVNHEEIEIIPMEVTPEGTHEGTRILRHFDDFSISPQHLPNEPESTIKRSEDTLDV